MPKQIE
ncbi:uncharacterized protein FFC1_15908 [Fusarium fujikuroi]|nr:uncharacterized protein FFC1_15908 [Fusarium fujikuroi]